MLISSGAGPASHVLSALFMSVMPSFLHDVNDIHLLRSLQELDSLCMPVLYISM